MRDEAIHFPSSKIIYVYLWHYLAILVDIVIDQHGWINLGVNLTLAKNKGQFEIFQKYGVKFISFKKI